MEWATAQSSDKWKSIGFHVSLDCTASDSVTRWKRRKMKNRRKYVKQMVWRSLFRTYLMESQRVYKTTSLVITFLYFLKRLKKSPDGSPNVVVPRFSEPNGKSDHQTIWFSPFLKFIIFRRLDRVMEWATAQSSDK